MRHSLFARSFLPLLPLFVVPFGCSGGSDTTPDPGSETGDALSDGSAESSDSDLGDSATDTGADGSDVGGAGDSDGGSCPSPPIVDTLRDERTKCSFKKSAKVDATLGVTKAIRDGIPITHVIVVTQENRSFDHYYGRLHLAGQPDAEGWPSTFTNPDKTGAKIAPFHATKTCLASDAPHQWASMRSSWDMGKMDGFITTAASATSDGHFVMQYYEQTDLPFYYWLSNQWAIGDRHFSSVLAGTWPNRDYLYAASSDGVTFTGERAITIPNIFDALDTAKVKWGVYTDGTPRQDCLGWTKAHAGVATFATFLAQLKDGTLPPVVFVDPSGASQDEHPPNDVQKGESWSRQIYLAATTSPLWSKLALIYTYDESGGLFEHVPPPKGCVAAAGQEAFDQQGFRVPLVVVSPYARRHFVSHLAHEHTSITRLIELLHDLPALTNRDANSDALLDMFDFGCAPPAVPSTPPAAGTGGCP